MDNVMAHSSSHGTIDTKDLENQEHLASGHHREPRRYRPRTRRPPLLEDDVGRPPSRLFRSTYFGEAR